MVGTRNTLTLYKRRSSLDALFHPDLIQSDRKEFFILLRDIMRATGRNLRITRGTKVVPYACELLYKTAKPTDAEKKEEEEVYNQAMDLLAKVTITDQFPQIQRYTRCGNGNITWSLREIRVWCC